MKDFEEGEKKRSSGVRPKKRKYHGNRFNTRPNKQVKLSSSFRKLNGDDILPPTDNDSVEPNFDGYRIFDINVLKKTIEEYLCCKVCNGEVKVHELFHHGLASKFELQCMKCPDKKNF